MANIGIDLDQVLADFSAAFDEYHDTTFGTNLREIPRTEFYLRNMFDITEEEELRRVKEFYGTDHFLNMKPFPDSIEAIKKLAENNKLFVITSRPDFITKETEDWLEKYYPKCFSEVIITSHYFGGTKKKSEVCLEKNIEIMVEDMAHYANDCADVGVKTFLLERPWNIKEEIHKNVFRVRDWAEVLEQLARI